MLDYSKYPLSRVINVYQIVTADYVIGTLLDTPHRHADALELIYALSGTCHVLRDGIHIPLSAGDAILISPGTEHSVSCDQEGAHFFVISFGCTCEYLEVLRNVQFHVTPRQRELFQEIMKELRAAFRLNKGELRLIRFRPNSKSPVGAEQLICCYLEQIMISFLREVTSENGRVVESRYFGRAIRQYMTAQVTDYVRAHLSEKLTVTDLARQFHYSRSRLSTLYKSTTGIGLNEFITREKISRAKTLLEEGTLSVTQISEQLGFSSPEYFSRRFTQCTGQTPSGYINRFRNKSAARQN